ncbi:MAG: glycoside hydrolase family 88 protein [Treponema sp.]|nr:glycoside hydrolase family 88 protein [Treponema sp.]
MDEKNWALDISKRIYEKTLQVAERNSGKIPYTSVDGRFDDWSDRFSWWTNGFWAGQLWLLYHAFGGDVFRAAAEAVEKKLDASLMDARGMDHDSGFKWLLSSVANFAITKNAASKNRAYLAAANLAGRFNLAGNFIRAWNDDDDGSKAGWAIIDCMMNLPLLYWASAETKDPHFAQIAERHADMAAVHFIREDGSAAHIAVFDPATGSFLKTLGGQGMCEGSSWTRGQGWALYGFSLSYRHTKKALYLETAEKVAAYCLAHIPASGIIPVDFCQPEDSPWEDSTAAAIMACGFLELEMWTGQPKLKARCHEAALTLLHTLAEKRCVFSCSVDHLVENGSVDYNGNNHHMPIIYGDYYFTEAVLRLCGKFLYFAHD